jgi:uridine kinase
MNPFFIGIAGPSCSGKSEVSRRLARILRAGTISLDHYYKDLKHVAFEERVKTNFDSPDSLDHELITTQVASLKRGKPVEQPTYDFANHIRAEATGRVESSEFMILEGLFALHWPEIRELLDARIYIEADHDVCLERRIFRDVRERGRTEASVRAQYEAAVRPMCDCYVVPSRQFAEVVLNGTDPVKQSVRTLLTHVADRVPDAARAATIRQSLSTWLASVDEDLRQAV